MKFTEVDKLLFGDIQRRFFQESSKADEDIKCNYETFKKEHFNAYKAAISCHNLRLFPLETKKTAINFFGNEVAPELPSPEKAFEDLNP
jgi:hypothetical protein